ncbi:MAG: permease-like cell division protein FtsX [Patescibacteria group bacterium]|nr:MAG: permease-like cell division protein FtsX [Patescibacteria group bacterium]
MFISFLRAVKFSLQDVVRNIWLSAVTVIILVLALFSVNLLLAVQVISQAAVDTVRDKIDISLYMKPEASESEVLALRGQINSLDNVREVVYVSKEQALEDFQARYHNSPEILEALREIGNNPLSASLAIRPLDIDRYDELIAELNNLSSPVIESRNFDNHTVMLDKINSITGRISEAGLVISLIFAAITLLVLYNTIRVAIYTHRQEIGVMRLVGASAWFIRAPFLISGLLYTLLGMIIASGLFYFFLTLLQPYLETFFLEYDFNIIAYFVANFPTFFAVQFIIAALVNMAASLVAVRKYSNI